MKAQGWQGVAPATGWLAVFVGEDGSLYTERVALWVWERDVDVDGTMYDGATGVLGRESMHPVEHADDAAYFVGYCHETEDIQVYTGRAQEVLERARRRREHGQ